MKKIFASLAVFALLALTALNAPAAITFDAASAGTAGTSATVTWGHIVGDSGPDRMLVVGIAAERTADAFPTSVTYGSQSLTKAVGSSANQSPVVSPINSTEIWYLPAPAIGSNNITVTFATSVANGMECGAVSLFGVSNSAPEAVSVANGATSGTTFTNVITTLTAGAWLVDVANSGAGAAINQFTSTTAGLTRRWNGASGLQLVGAGGTREVLTAGTVTNTWTSTGSSRRAQSTAAFAPAPPSAVAVAITSPTNTAVVSSTSFSVNANATVNPGTVTNVAFYLDAALVGNDTSYPFSFVVSGASAGAHTLTAVATSGGISATSAVVNVTAANLPPTVALTSPANGSPVLVGASVPLVATAADDNTVTNVDFYVDGSLVGSDNSSPYNGTYASATLGSHSLTAVAQDNGGLSTTSSVVTITGYTSFAAYEPFNYTTSIPNGTASTASGFTGNWTCGTTPSIVAGMTYTGLPTANSAMSTTGGRMYENFLAPLSGGTEYVSFLFKCSGDPGGNLDGVYLKGDQANSIWAGFRAPFNGIVNSFGLATVTSAGTATTGGTSQGTSVNITNTTTHLIVLKIDFNTSGNNDTVTLYVDPAANTASPSVAATTTLTTVDVGTISAMGVNAQGGTTMTVDEFRRGSTFGEVVGYNPPTTPTNLVATAGVNTVSLTWSNASGATGYNILRGTSSGNYTVTNTSASNAYNDNSAVGGTTYFYAVQATNASGASANSSEVSATPTIALPSTPTGLVAVGTNGAVSLSWNAAAGAASYNVKRSTTSNAEITISNVVANSYYDTDVINGTTYFYKVSSTNSAGQSGNSSEVSATPNLPPSTPTGLAATAGTNQVSLTWTASAGATSYNIKRATTSGAEVTIASTGLTGYTDITAIKFTQYFYTVSAVSANGESADSGEVDATPTGVYGASAYEPFDYASLPNGTASTAAGFTGNWTVSGSPSISAGLTYPGLPTTNNAYVHGAAGAQTTVDFASPFSSGTKFISFLIQGPGNPGANTCGVFLKGNNASSLFAGFEGGFSPTLTSFGLGTVNSTALGSATVLGSTTPIDNTTVHLMVVGIEFNTSGANDTVSLWIDPPASTNAPGVAANVVNSTFDVGTISALGININGAFAIGLDEVRVGEVYGDVVGYSLPVVVVAGPTNITSSVLGNQLTLGWPSTHLGWFLQTQTNSRSIGITTNWFDVSGSETGTNSVITIDRANPTVFFRLRSP